MPCAGLVNSLDNLGLPDLSFADDKFEFATRRKGVKLVKRSKTISSISSSTINMV